MSPDESAVDVYCERVLLLAGAARFFIHFNARYGKITQIK